MNKKKKNYLMSCHQIKFEHNPAFSRAIINSYVMISHFICFHLTYLQNISEYD